MVVTSSMTKSNIERKEFVFSLQLLYHPPLLQELREEHKPLGWSQERRKKPWRTTTYYSAPFVFLSLLSYTTWDHLTRVGTTHNGLGLFTAIVIRKIMDELVYRVV